MNRSPRKKTLKTIRAARRPAPDTKRGFRKLVVGDQVFHWRHHGSKVEIRTPQKGKHMVPVWELQGLTEDAWLKEHQECWEECFANVATPGMIHGYLSKQKLLGKTA